MLDWYLLFLTPLLVLPIVALFVFVGCTLWTSALIPEKVVTFRVIFDPALGGEDASFDIRLDIVPDNDPESVIHEGQFFDREPDGRIDGKVLFEIKVGLWPRDYTVTCRVFASNEEEAIVQSAPCHVALPNGTKVTFETDDDESWFEPCQVDANE